MTTTSTRRLVSVDLEATKQALAEKGDDVTLELPDGDDVAGTITSVGKVAEKNVTADDDDPPATIEVRIALKRSRGRAARPGAGRRQLREAARRERAHRPGHRAAGAPGRRVRRRGADGHAAARRAGRDRACTPTASSRSTAPA